MDGLVSGCTVTYLYVLSSGADTMRGRPPLFLLMGSVKCGVQSPTGFFLLATHTCITAEIKQASKLLLRAGLRTVRTACMFRIKKAIGSKHQQHNQGRKQREDSPCATAVLLLHTINNNLHDSSFFLASNLGRILIGIHSCGAKILLSPASSIRTSIPAQ